MSRTHHTTGQSGPSPHVTNEAVDLKRHTPTSGQLVSPNGSVLVDRSYQVKTVTWKGHIKRLRLEPGSLSLDVPLSACVTRGDQVRVESGDAWVIGKNGDCQFLQPYVVPDVVNLGGVQREVLVKEITEHEENLEVRQRLQVDGKPHPTAPSHPQAPKPVGALQLGVRSLDTSPYVIPLAPLLGGLGPPAAIRR